MRPSPGTDVFKTDSGERIAATQKETANDQRKHDSNHSSERDRHITLELVLRWPRTGGDERLLRTRRRSEIEWGRRLRLRKQANAEPRENGVLLMAQQRWAGAVPYES